MKALDVARYVVGRYGTTHFITNLKLNKLLYYMQVESLRKRNRVLFDDVIEAWDYGPVEPAVYRRYSMFGSSRIQTVPGATLPDVDAESKETINFVMECLGGLTAFDLVSISHRDTGAWHKVYKPNLRNTPISIDTICESGDMQIFDHIGLTLVDGIKDVESHYPNALRMLENS